MNRRSFLRWLGGTAAGIAIATTLDIEKLLWVPGEKVIFVPPLVTSGNVFLTSELITREAMRVLTNNLAMVRMINREYDAGFRFHGAPIRVVNGFRSTRRTA